MKKTIKIISLAILVTLSSITIFAQNKEGKADDLGRIVINAYVGEQIEGMPASARRMLANKLAQVTTKNGLGGSSLNPRFIITPNITVLSKDITSTAPPMTAMTMDVTVYVGDGIEGTLFSSASVTVKGVGTNETKAYIAALKRISPNNPDIKACLEEGKRKIIEYYNSRCDFIIKEAQALEAQNKFDEAIFKLTTVPEVCKECFDKCMDAVAPIYQKQIDRECQIRLTAAQNAWNAGQDVAAADKAAGYLQGIEPNASCYGDAAAFSNTVAKRVLELDKREWDFKMKVWDDTVDLRKQTIKAARDVGVAYGNHQPQNVSYNVRGWF